MPKEQIYNKLKPEEQDDFRKKFSKETAHKMPIDNQIELYELKARVDRANKQKASFEEKSEGRANVSAFVNNVVERTFRKHADIMDSEGDAVFDIDGVGYKKKDTLLEITLSDGEKKKIGVGSRFTLRGTLGNSKEKALKGGYQIIGTRITKDKIELVQAKKNPNDKNEKPFEFTKAQFEQYFKRDAVLFTASDKRQDQLNKKPENKKDDSLLVSTKLEQPQTEETTQKNELPSTENKKEKKVIEKITAETRLWSNDKVTRGIYKIKELPGKGNNEQYIFVSESPSKKPITLRFTEKRLLKDLQEDNVQEIITDKKTQVEPKNLAEISPTEKKIEDLKNKIAELMKEMPNGNLGELDNFEKFFKGIEEKPISTNLAKVIQSGNKQITEELLKLEYEKSELILKGTEQTKN